MNFLPFHGPYQDRCTRTDITIDNVVVDERDGLVPGHVVILDQCVSDNVPVVDHALNQCVVIPGRTHADDGKIHVLDAIDISH
jgi:hypothetical protein